MAPTPILAEVHVDQKTEAQRDVVGDGDWRVPGVTTGRVASAANLLVRHGAQFVEEALLDNPDGPVRMTIEISRTEVDYDVTIGLPDDNHPARTIWHKAVHFGHADRSCAGGAAFVEAGREQDAVAFAALELLESRR